MCALLKKRTAKFGRMGNKANFFYNVNILKVMKICDNQSDLFPMPYILKINIYLCSEENMSSSALSFSCKINVTLCHTCHYYRSTPWFRTWACVLMNELSVLLQEKIGKEGIRRTTKENSADRLAFIKLARPQNFVGESLRPHIISLGNNFLLNLK